MAGPTPRALIALDLLRFGCALLVVAFHFGTVFGFTLHLGEAWRGRFGFGWIGVQLFFVISGYVIARSAQHAAPGAFVRKRALRLLPAVWICATGTMIVRALTDPPPHLIAAWLQSAALLPGGYRIDSAYWTLGIELYFYALIATGLRAGRDGSASIERRAVLLCIASAGFWATTLLAGWDAVALGDSRPVQLLLLPHGCYFALGILIRAMTSYGATPRRVALSAVCVAAAIVQIAVRTREANASFEVHVAAVVPLLVFAAGVAVILGARRVQRPLARLVDARLAATLGLMTYPLYLLHQEIAHAVIVALRDRGVPTGTALAVAFATVLGLAWWVARIAEPPLRDRLAAALDLVGAILRRAPRPDSRRSASPPIG